ncbi:hypothetical protein C8Q76DRAFT_467108 [Earliella scabrosa]|nr:hypothetical protein C8Q76DRAFT_467108 [Earliella scabrosa]
MAKQSFSHYPVDITGGLADEDKAVLSQLDPSHIQDWAKARIQEYESRIHALRCMHNAAAPIHRTLPTEVLMEVFGSVQATSRYRLFATLRVCRLWRHLVLRTPQFWANVVHEKTALTITAIPRLSLFLDLSGTLPVALTLNRLASGAVEMLEPHIHRITDMKIQALLEDMGNLDALLRLKRRMPLLERLSVRCTLPHQFGANLPPISLDRLRFPSLRALRYPLWRLDMGSFDDRLRTLEISRFHARYVCDIPSLLRILERCVSLETLRIFSVSLRLPASDAPPRDPLPLPTLRHLHLRDGACRQGTGLLSELVVPPTCLVKYVSTQFSADTSFLELLPSDLSTFSRVSDAPGARLVFTYPPPGAHSIGTLETYADLSCLDKVLSVAIERVSFEGCLQQAAAAFSPFGKLMTLSLHADDAPATRNRRSDILALLRGLPQLRGLSFGLGDGRCDILPLLGRAGSDVEGGCLCPDLLWLGVFWRHEYGGLLDGEDDRASQQHVPTLSPFCDVLLETLTHRKALGTSELPDVDVWVLRDAEFEARYGEDAQWGLDRIKQRLKARLGVLSEDIGLEVAYVCP